MKKIVLKYIIVGDTCVGKTCILSSLMNEPDEEKCISTIGISLRQYNCKYNDKNININIWDTAGQERYNSLSKMYYRNSCCVILVFDVTNKKSFENLHLWINKVKAEIYDNYQLIIVGNKTDRDDRVVSYDEAKCFANNFDANYYETSKLNRENMKTMMTDSLDKSIEIFEDNANFSFAKKKQSEIKKSSCYC
ncbi:rab domain-containing protein [Bodo saltans virus]|jgi:small GTP-binding protein|uniref:Rab domain-containing protein n=1 Tax=Bodo saltans virus TaxID=2024608 RepID=A0A2H4UTQ5_9VIRU|nr:rab domain-containing protein [Bodo saltans virus]ATZ80205.1 rab domain-containing protein [Bodo saltans virus]